MALKFARTNIDAPRLPSIGRGCRWEYLPGGESYDDPTDASACLVSSRDDGNVFVEVFNATGTASQILTINTGGDPTASTSLKFNPGDAGAGGLISGETEAAGKFYHIHLISKAGGADPALIGLLAGNTFATGGYTPPAGYTLFSQVLFGVSNSEDFDSGNDDMVPFINFAPGECQYITGDGAGSTGEGIEIITSATAASNTVISLANAVPAAPGRAKIRLAANQDHNEGLNNLKIYQAWYGNINADKMQLRTLASLGTTVVNGGADGSASTHTAGGLINTEQVMDFPLAGGVGLTTGTPANIMWYKWNNQYPTGGAYVNRLTVYLLGWKLEG